MDLVDAGIVRIQNMFAKRVMLLVILGGLPLLALAQSSQKDIRIDGVAAYVNSHTITVSDVLKSSRDIQMLMSKRMKDPAEVDKLYQQALQALIDRKLIVDDYESQKKIKIPDTVFDDRANSIITDMFKGVRSDFLDALAHDNISEDQWRQNLRERTIVSAMKNLDVDSKVTISPLAAYEIYKKNRDQYATEPSVKLSMIIIAKGSTPEEKKQQKKKLKKVLVELRDTKDFARVAKKYSEDSYAKNGGARDWTKRDMLRKELADTAFATKRGGIRFVDIGKQYCIIKVDDKTTSDVIPFEEARPLIEAQLRKNQAEKLQKVWLARLRKNAFIKVIDKTPFSGKQ
jgi:parvulin-like peptidyl-prolyl isomerase